MITFIKLTLVILATVVTTATPAGAARRVALVIGNSAYRHAGALANPRNDATDIAAALRKSDFQVLEALDVDKPAFDRKIRDFASALSDAEAGVLFYAGHGLQVAGKNYLVPIDAELTTADSLEFEMVQLDTIHRIMERQTTTNILFIDACRNNPLARNLSRAMGTRSAEIGRGLAPVESGVGTLISFSTQPGNVALDGAGRNSPYAAALIKRISTSGDDLSALLIDVRNDVRKDTQNKQIPWEHSALTGRFYFNGQRLPAASSGSTAPSVSEAAQAWSAIKDSTNRSILEAFIKQFGATVYAAMAQARLDELKHQEASNAPTIKIPGASQPSSASPRLHPATNENYGSRAHFRRQ